MSVESGKRSFTITRLLGSRLGLKMLMATTNTSSLPPAVRSRARVIWASLKKHAISRHVIYLRICAVLNWFQNHIDRIRSDYQRDLSDKVMMHRMRATAMYFIDRLALRAGNEKGEDEADTVGCCSLRCEHITLEPPSSLVFDFLGKDSIRYYNKVEVDAKVFKNVKIFKRDKQESDDLFDRISVRISACPRCQSSLNSSAISPPCSTSTFNLI